MVLASALLAASPALSACGGHESAPTPEPSPTASRAPAYDGSLAPAKAALALVPAAATTLTVTDYDQVRVELGMPDVTGRASQTGEFWARTDRLAVLTSGRLRPVDARLEQDYGFSQADVDWEADFHGGGADGWVLRLRDGIAMAAVRRAVKAGVGPLRGATVDAAHHLVMRGASSPGQANWAAEPGLSDLVVGPALATYVQRGCLAGDTRGQRLSALDAYAVEFGGTLATARLGAGREDLFARLRLGRSLPEFARIFTRGVADPNSGRIGFEMADPVSAANLTLRHRLPFAVCAS